ncbi:hypothetical protein [Roseovarius sp. PS-C2]|uniref:hypothetical protein n=1 Tax=Roseovarius sp. PS-C2 TaxID=2820814 RepID=UPI0034600DE1
MEKIDHPGAIVADRPAERRGYGNVPGQKPAGLKREKTNRANPAIPPADRENNLLAGRSFDGSEPWILTRVLMACLQKKRLPFLFLRRRQSVQTVNIIHLQSLSARPAAAPAHDPVVAGLSMRSCSSMPDIIYYHYGFEPGIMIHFSLQSQIVPLYSGLTLP